MSQVIGAVQRHVGEPKQRFHIYAELIPVFEDLDADTLHECLGKDPAYDEAYEKVAYRDP